MVKFMLDPGHGGTDPGAVGNGLQEKALTLTIAKKIGALLSQYEGVQVGYTRTDDRYLSLAERADIANKWSADYFCSIHINAGGGTGWESFIHTNAGSKSVTCQNVIHPEVMKFIGGTDRGKKRANFGVLRMTNMPAILTENLFIDNPADAAKLKSDAFLQAIAHGHVNGFEKAFELKKKAGAQSPAQNKEEVEMLEKAIVINSFVDFPVSEPLAARLKAPIYIRAALPAGKVAKEVFVVGGDASGIQADKHTVLAGPDRYATAAAIKKFLG
jgi:N-acetylmuramoyl-L-alanine amidase